MTARSILGWMALLLLLLVGLPFHVCMPLWVDAHFFDLAAKVLLRGGILYQEVFYTGPPAMMFTQAAIRSVVGWSSEALRAVDFLMVLSSILLLTCVVLPPSPWSGGRVWATVLLLFFYLGTNEQSHCEPDVWMLLPALIAFLLRVRQARELMQPNVKPTSLAAWACVEGLLWGVAILFKPFVLMVTVGCWALTLLWTRAAFQGTTGRLAADLLGLLSGGLFVGALTLAWMVHSGNWPYFAEFFHGGWAGEYYNQSPGWQTRIINSLQAPWPWGMLHLVAIPLALRSIFLSFWRIPTAGPNSLTQDFTLPLLSASYLLWFYQANFIQYQAAYHQVPPVMLGLVLFLGTARRSTFRFFWASTLVSFCVWAAVEHPLTHLPRLSLWTTCWKEGATPRLWDELGLLSYSSVSPNHVELEMVAEFLRDQGVRDRELTCFSVSTLSLCKKLDIKPSTRFLLLHTILIAFSRHREVIVREVDSSPQRYFVWDVRSRGIPPAQEREEVMLPAAIGDVYPFFREPVVFRSGRFVVHRIRPPEERAKDSTRSEFILIPAPSSR